MARGREDHSLQGRWTGDPITSPLVVPITPACPGLRPSPAARNTELVAKLGHIGIWVDLHAVTFCMPLLGSIFSLRLKWNTLAY